MSKTIEISDELYESIKDQLCDGGASEIEGLADFVNEKLFIRTVTYHLVGRVVAVNGTLIELADASVVFDSGNFSTALKNGALTSSEWVGRCWINSSSITDMFPWDHSLPKAVK